MHPPFPRLAYIDSSTYQLKCMKSMTADTHHEESQITIEPWKQCLNPPLDGARCQFKMTIEIYLQSQVTIYKN